MGRLPSSHLTEISSSDWKYEFIEGTLITNIMALSKAKKKAGHASHTQTSDITSLPGVMLRPIKITMLGAGSGFTPRLVTDVISIPGNQGGVIALVDIDPKRLSTMHKLIQKLFAQRGAKNWKVTASTDRTKALPGTTYIVNCIEVSGLGCVRFDNDIPARYGIDQCIGDTIGPGGLFKALRTIPVWIEVLRDAERFCPDALVLNYTNPMSMLCLAAGRTSSMKVVGLCHSVQGTSHLLAKRASIRCEEMEWECAGINHLAWFTKLRHEGKDLYPLLRKLAEEDLAGKPSNPEDAVDLVRKDMMLHFGRSSPSRVAISPSTCPIIASARTCCSATPARPTMASRAFTPITGRSGG
jgi:alpha-galactosidase